MFRGRTTKQTYIIAMLVILLCLSCLAGATLALFTSDLNDGTIGIITTAGTVDVDIVDASSNPQSLVDQVLTLQTTSQRSEIYFEPGAYYYTEGFRVQNKGSLPINFRLYISEDASVDMQAFRQAFEIWITKSPDSMVNSEQMAPFEGRLEAQTESDIYYLCIKMKENAGNEFQGKSYEKIGVTVFAVQANVSIEESFENE